ncbi:PREDICTED: ankyrin repeat domain-containing protein 2B [Camelina sativa]|uniref:Ankyrin repeat domain-containing protein 2B n=1 Tax=Camelina sativa TaxID=90675 RepID=A0ABM0V7M8_CAMSA|nr:PREDICTED: ankyrin repeat domain-containing protein 2B [Camelina sativa]
MEQSLSPSGSVDSKDMHGLLESNALDSPSPSVIDKEENMVESSAAEKVDTVPRYIQLAKELQRSIPVAWNQHGSITEFDEELYNNRKALVLENPQIQKLMECQDPQSSLKALGNPEASDKFAELMVQLEKDAELESIVAEIKASPPAAMLKYWNDKIVLKKLGKSMSSIVHDTSTLGDVEDLKTLASGSGDDNDEQVSEGRKALKIACEHTKMKCIKILLEAEEKANAVDKGRKKKIPLH